MELMNWTFFKTFSFLLFLSTFFIYYLCKESITFSSSSINSSDPDFRSCYQRCFQNVSCNALCYSINNVCSLFESLTIHLNNSMICVSMNSIWIKFILKFSNHLCIFHKDFTKNVKLNELLVNTNYTFLIEIIDNYNETIRTSSLKDIKSIIFSKLFSLINMKFIQMF